MSCQVPRGSAGHDGPAGRSQDAEGAGPREAEAGLGGENAGHLARLEAEGVAEEVNERNEREKRRRADRKRACRRARGREGAGRL